LKELSLTTDSSPPNIYAVSASSGKVEITNSKNYSLPEAGGIGTMWFTLCGTAIIVGCFMYIIYRRKNDYTKQGGEG
jgi:LPXTG-motif cell wall-anchored protein